MKDSGVQWIGRIPVGWKIARTKYVAQLRSGHTPSRQHPEYWENCTIPWFSLADVWQIRDGRRDYVEQTSEKISELGLANSAARLLPAGTVMLSRTASVGFAAIAAQPMATTQDFVNWICGLRILPEYLLLVFRAMQPEFKRLTSGSTHQTIYMPDVSDFVTPLPSVEQQRLTVRFANEQTAKIDRLVVLRRRQMELLREQHAALIRQAVTCGLNPRSPLKDSGVPWLGRIPNHWTVKPLKHIARFVQTGSTPPSANLDYYDESGMNWYGPGDFAGALQLGASARRISVAAIRDGCADAYDPPVILIVGIGASVGKIGVAVQRCSTNQQVNAIGLSVEHSAFFIANFLTAYSSVIAANANYATLPIFNQTQTRNFPVVVPPPPEQRKIAEFIQREEMRFDRLRSAYARQIDLLTEYRAALIHECVTGQRPVPAA